MKCLFNACLGLKELDLTHYFIVRKALRLVLLIVLHLW